jgi:hypothetical protein
VAQALRVPLFRLFTDDPHAKKLHVPKTSVAKNKHDRELESFIKAVSNVSDERRQLFLYMVSLMAVRE